MLRWRVTLLVSAAIAISYLDRQALPVARARIELKKYSRWERPHTLHRETRYADPQTNSLRSTVATWP